MNPLDLLSPDVRPAVAALRAENAPAPVAARGRLKTPPSVDWLHRRLDRAIRTLQAIRRGFLQRGEPVAALRIADKIDTLQAFRVLSFGRALGDYNASRPLFPRPQRRRKATR